MNPKSYVREQGFTLVELLLVCAIILILGSLSIQAYVIHKDRAYHSIALEAMNQTRLALEAGKIDSENFPDATMRVNQTTSGPATDGQAAQLVPGLVVPENSKIFVYHNPLCFGGSCIQDQIETRHCSTDKVVKFWHIYVMGEAQDVYIDNAAADGDC